MSKIYMVERDDYDSHHIEGYFTDLDKAKAYCEYNNRLYPSPYYEGYGDEEFMWQVVEYNLYTRDYKALLAELDRKEKMQRHNDLTNELSSFQKQMQELQTKINEINAELSEQKGSNTNENIN